MFKVPEKYIITSGTFGSDSTFGNNGDFVVPLNNGITKKAAFIIASDGLGWEHVSVHIQIGNKQFIPTWEEMCMIKDLFWESEDCVIQFHPPKKDYVNTNKSTLHLWRPGKNIEIPDKLLV